LASIRRSLGMDSSNQGDDDTGHVAQQQSQTPALECALEIFGFIYSKPGMVALVESAQARLAFGLRHSRTSLRAPRAKSGRRSRRKRPGSLPRWQGDAARFWQDFALLISLPSSIFRVLELLASAEAEAQLRLAPELRELEDWRRRSTESSFAAVTARYRADA